MLKKVEVQEKNFENYKPFISEAIKFEIKQNASLLRGKKIIHINSTAQGGGVAEILHSLIPIEKSLGLDVDWLVFSNFKNQEQFFEITKKMHNSLQGSSVSLSSEEKKLYCQVNHILADEISSISSDLLVIHDPQPCALISDFNEIPMISRIHIDLTNPNSDTLNFIGEYLERYDTILFSCQNFVPKNVELENTVISHPAIDPLTVKNQDMGTSEAEEILANLNIDCSRPLLTQVSRFDPWKDPFGVIDAFKVVKKKYPTAQLVLSGIVQAQDDPEAIRIIEDVKKKATEEKDIFLFTAIEQLKGISDLKFINALQSRSDVIFQKSLREGFGLTVTEAMWKGQPVIGGNVGGIRLQIKDGVNGFLVNSPTEAAEKALFLLDNPDERKRMGQAARESVKEKFLITRFLQDELKIMSGIRKKVKI